MSCGRWVLLAWVYGLYSGAITPAVMDMAKTGMLTNGTGRIRLIRAPPRRTRLTPQNLLSTTHHHLHHRLLLRRQFRLPAAATAQPATIISTRSLFLAVLKKPFSQRILKAARSSIFLAAPSSTSPRRI